MFHDDQPSRLDLLGDLPGCHLAPGYPDPRGWSVATENGWEIGHLKDLVVDARTLEELLEFFTTEVGVDAVFCDHPDVAVRVRDKTRKVQLAPSRESPGSVDSPGKTGLE